MLFLFILPVLTLSTIIETPLGLIKGAEFTARDGSSVRAFKHVPFAKPPLGKLRFALPVPPEPWKDIRDGTKYGPACMSNSSKTTSPQKWVDEDCLHNNIFVSDRCLMSKSGCPVVFYIHGGAFNYDSAVMFPDEEMVNNFGANDVVLVISAFRLGVFSQIIFDNDNVLPRNLPAYDLLMSLRWIQGNIHSFGGDRKSVTLMGHSGGAAAVTALAFSKTVDPHRKLFHRGISMSGPGVLPGNEVSRRLKTWEFAQKAGCVPYQSLSMPSDNYVRDVVDCLRKKVGLELLAVQREMEEEGYVFDGLLIEPPLFPADGIHDFMSNPPEIPLMLGATWFEMNNWATQDYSVTISDVLGLKHPMAVAAKYQSDKEAGKLGFNSTSETQSMFVGIYKMAEEVSLSGTNAYLYSYRYWRHAEHTDDLSYIMGVHKFDMDNNEKILAKLYPQYFINFIKHGVPHPEWKPFRVGADNYYSINVNVQTGLKPHNELNVIKYWTKNMVEFDKSYKGRSMVSGGLLAAKGILEMKSSIIPITSGSISPIIIVFGCILIGVLIGRYLSWKRNLYYVLIPNENTSMISK